MCNVELNKKKKEFSVFPKCVYNVLWSWIHYTLLLNFKTVVVIRLFLSTKESCFNMESLFQLFLESKLHKCCTSERFLLHRISKYCSVCILDLCTSLMEYWSYFYLFVFLLGFLNYKKAKITKLPYLKKFNTTFFH